MKNAFQRCFSDGFASVVLIGSDIPDLPPEIFAEAFAALDNSGAVIGPAADGGYYLIGFRKETFVPEVFGGIAWSTGTVFAETWPVWSRAGVGVHRLPLWRDVDTPEDLRDLIRRHRDTPFARSRTMACLAAANPAGLFARLREKDGVGRNRGGFGSAGDAGRTNPCRRRRTGWVSYAHGGGYGCREERRRKAEDCRRGQGLSSRIAAAGVMWPASRRIAPIGREI